MQSKISDPLLRASLMVLLLPGGLLFLVSDAAAATQLLRGESVVLIQQQVEAEEAETVVEYSSAKRHVMQRNGYFKSQLGWQHAGSQVLLEPTETLADASPQDVQFERTSNRLVYLGLLAAGPDSEQLRYDLQ